MLMATHMYRMAAAPPAGSVVAAPSCLAVARVTPPLSSCSGSCRAAPAAHVSGSGICGARGVPERSGVEWSSWNGTAECEGSSRGTGRRRKRRGSGNCSGGFIHCPVALRIPEIQAHGGKKSSKNWDAREEEQTWRQRVNAATLSGSNGGKPSWIVRVATSTDEAVLSTPAAVESADVLLAQSNSLRRGGDEEILREATAGEQANASSAHLSSQSGSSPSSPSVLFSRTKEESLIVRTAWEKLVRWSKSWQLLQARRQGNALQRTKKVVVLGGGSFGTAVAVLLARNKIDMEVTLLLRDKIVCDSINDVHVNSKYFPRHLLPVNVGATTDARAALHGAEYCVHAVPVQSSAAFLRSISEHVPPTLPFLSVSKGLELSTLEMMSQVIPRALGNPRQPVVVLSGPSFSIELMDELPTALVAASKDKDLAKAAQQLLASRHLRVNTSSDVVGVEMAGALKNVLAIAAGIVEGMNLGNNCMAALVAQGCAEIRWLAEKMGAKPATLAGLSGTGDIMLTCFVKLSRNRSVGVRLGAGEKLEDILASMSQVAEGVATAGAVIALARKYRVQMPILTAVARILENELTPKKAVLALMSLPQGEEV